jgi:antagonist of KipI
MSLRVIKAGIFDSIQDNGRYGYQHLGINPGGSMDRFSSQLANALLGNSADAPVIELHFPAAQILFEKPAIICLAGADFTPTINGKQIPMHHPLAVGENALLKFERLQNGARTYLALFNELTIEKWMGSYSTNLKAAAGGFNGRQLERYDCLEFRDVNLKQVLNEKEFVVLPWKANETVDNRNEIQFVIGSEWHWMNKEMQTEFQNHWFQLTNEADRMGYRLAGPKLETESSEQLVSAPAGFGTVQLLPNGQLIVLMADHQTTGGYPRIAHVISAHLPVLAQKKPNDVLRFIMTDLATAEEKTGKQQKYLHEIQLACKFRMQTLLNDL